MLQKHRKLIFATLAVLLVGLLIWGVSFFFPAPHLSKITKKKVQTEYLNWVCRGSMWEYSQRPIIWYDENGDMEEENVWRYVGKYGDCYAFLRIDDNEVSADGMPLEPPYLLSGLAWNVKYHCEAYVYLYHTKKEFNRSNGMTTRMCGLSDAWVKSEKWLTDEQLEQLTQDIEKLAQDDSSYVRRLHNGEKGLVRQEYFERYCRGEIQRYLDNPITWYDENGYIEEEDVWRYVGKYGDCYAFLRIGDNKNLNGKPTPDPYPLRGLARAVFYPNEAVVYLYHAQREFDIDTGFEIVTTSIEELPELTRESRREWLTDEQLEQLAQDIEKLAKDYN